MNKGRKFQNFEILEEKDEIVLVEEEKRLIGHTANTHFSLYFGSPTFKIVTNGDDNIRIWDSKTFECVHVVRSSVLLEGIIHMIKWDNDEFFCSYEDKSIKFYRISENFNRTMRIDLESVITRLLKLNKDEFVGKNRDSELVFFSYSNKRITKKYKVGISLTSPNFTLSSKFKNSFYFQTNDDNETIYLIDFSKDIIKKSFFGEHDTNEPIIANCIFQNSRKEEILVICNTFKIIYFYNTSDTKYTRKTHFNIQSEEFQNQIENEMENPTPKNYSLLPPEGKVLSCFNLENQFLCLGGFTGEIFFYELNFCNGLLNDSSVTNKIKSIGKKKIHSGTIKSVNLVSVNHKKKKIRMISCSFDNSICVSNVVGFNFKEKMFIVDLKDRISFLENEKKKFIFSSGNEKKKYFVDLKLSNMKIKNCLNLFFF